MMKKNKLWKHPYHKGIDYSAENEVKSFGFTSYSEFNDLLYKEVGSNKLTPKQMKALKSTLLWNNYVDYLYETADKDFYNA